PADPLAPSGDRSPRSDIPPGRHLRVTPHGDQDSYRSPKSLQGAKTALVLSELQLLELPGDLQAARSYWWISPPRTLRRRISDGATSTATSGALSSALWRAQVSATVRAMLVVMQGVFIQDRVQVPWPVNQHPVSDLGPDGAHPAFGIGIGPRAARRDLHHLD